MTTRTRLRTSRSPADHVGWTRRTPVRKSRSAPVLSSHEAHGFGPVVALPDTTPASSFRAIAQLADVEAGAEEHGVDAKFLGTLQGAQRDVVVRPRVLDAVWTHPYVNQFVGAYDACHRVWAEWHFEHPFAEIATRATAQRGPLDDSPFPHIVPITTPRHQLGEHGVMTHANDPIRSASRTSVQIASPKTRRAARSGPSRERSTSNA